MVMLDLPLSAEASARLSDRTISPPASPAPSPFLDTQTWHVAVTRVGMFPMSEARCPCEKAPCGLVIPRPEVECSIHHAYAALHQAHSAQDCRSMRNAGRAGQRASRRAGRKSDRAARSGLIDGLLRR